MRTATKLVEEGTCDSFENAANELDALVAHPVLIEVLRDMELDAQTRVLDAPPTDSAARDAAVADWRAVRSLHSKLKKEADFARRKATENERT